MNQYLAAALVKAQAEMPAVEKSKTVTVTTQKGTFSYDYATLDHLIAKTLPVLNKHGLSMTQFPVQLDNGGLGLLTQLAHGDSGETWGFTMPIPNPGHSMQELGSAITYARRYAWSAALGIASEQDDDGAAATHSSKAGADGGESPAAEASSILPRSASASPFQPPPGVVGDGNGYAASRADAPADGGDPSRVEIHFSKNAGKKLGDLTRKQLEWYANTWEPDPRYANAADGRLKAAAQILCGVTPDPAPAPDDDIPF